MPPVVAGLATVGLWVTGAGIMSTVAAVTVGVLTIATVFSIGYSIYSMATMPDMPGYSAEVRGRTQVVRSAVQPHRIIYGTCMVSGPLIYGPSCGENNKYIYLVVVLAAHEVEEIGDVYLGDTLSTDDRFKVVTPEQPEEGYWQGGGDMEPVYYVTRPYKAAVSHDYVTITKHLGASDQAADAALIADTNGEWTAQHHTLSGRAYVVVRLEWNPDIFPTGIPNIKAVVKGKKVYDPRSSTTAWSDNWALCVRDYLTSASGLRCTASDVDDTQTIAAANICDEAVALAGGGTEPRYTMNGTFTLDQTPVEIMRKLLTAAAGHVIWSQGAYQIHPAAWQTPVKTLTESDLAGDISIQPIIGLKDRCNTIRGTFVDPAKAWQPTDFPIVKNSTALTRDGRELVQNIELPFTTSAATSQRIAKIHLERQLQEINVTIPCKLTAFTIQPGDVIGVTIARLGWSSKYFRVTGWNLTDRGEVQLQLREDDSTVYDWNSGMETVIDPAPDTNLPSPWVVAPPANITVTETLVRGNVPSIIINRTTLAWTSAEATSGEYDVQINGIYHATVRDPGIIIDNLDPRLYEFSVRARNSMGVSSGWTYKQHTLVGKTAPPADVPWCVVQGRRVDFGSVTDLDLAGYEVRYQIGYLVRWDTASKAHDGLTNSPFVMPPLPPNTYTIMVKAVDTTGNYSLNPVFGLVTYQDSTLLGERPVANIVETFDRAAENWPGTLTSGTRSAGDIVATNDSLFWSSDSYDIWSYNTGNIMFAGSYNDMTYTDSITITAALQNSQMTIDTDLSGNFPSVSYRLPGYEQMWSAQPNDPMWGDSALSIWTTADFMPWPGAVNTKPCVYEFRLSSGSGPLEGRASSLLITIDVPDIDEYLDDVDISASGTRLTLGKTYSAIKTVGLTMQADGGTAVRASVIDKSTTGPLIETYNGAGTKVTGRVDVHIQGY